MCKKQKFKNYLIVIGIIFLTGNAFFSIVFVHLSWTTYENYDKNEEEEKKEEKKKELKESLFELKLIFLYVICEAVFFFYFIFRDYEKLFKLD